MYEGPAFNVIVGNAQFASGGMRLSPRSFPGDGVADVLVFTGPRSDAYTLLPAMYRHGDHVPHPHIREMRAKIRVSIDADRPAARRRGRRDARHHARDVPGGPSIDPAEAMTADHETRRERLAAELAEDRLAAVVVAPSPDLVYLTGYGPMPLERLTLLVIRPDGAAVLVVPELERQLALDSAAGQTLETDQVVGWRDGDDPYDLVASILPRRGTGGDRGPDMGVARARRCSARPRRSRSSPRRGSSAVSAP